MIDKRNLNLSFITKAAKAVLVFILYFTFFGAVLAAFPGRVKALDYASQYSAEVYDRTNGLGSSQVNTVCQTIDMTEENSSNSI